MPSFTATAPGKIILFGEHAVVYGGPAIAVPVSQVSARVVVKAEPRSAPGAVRILAPDINLDADLGDLPPNQPLRFAVSQVLSTLGMSRLPACTIQIKSSIPVAAGLGSGAAVSVALLRALSAFLGQPLQDERVCALAYEVEKLYHGTPSGIDNTVITYAQPVYFIKGKQITTFSVKIPFTIVIGDTGIASPTAVAVNDLRRAWQSNPEPYEALFDAAGRIALKARQAIEGGRPEALGTWMDENHTLLQLMGVSSPELDGLVAAARTAGALGAKLSGGGRGGNMIALVTPERAAGVAEALLRAGGTRTWITEIK